MKSSIFRGPMAVFADEGVGENHELAHDGGQGQLGDFCPQREAGRRRP